MLEMGSHNSYVCKSFYWCLMSESFNSKEGHLHTKLYMYQSLKYVNE